MLIIAARLPSKHLFRVAFWIQACCFGPSWWKLFLFHMEYYIISVNAEYYVQIIKLLQVSTWPEDSQERRKQHINRQRCILKLIISEKKSASTTNTERKILPFLLITLKVKVSEVSKHCFTLQACFFWLWYSLEHVVEKWLLSWTVNKYSFWTAVWQYVSKNRSHHVLWPNNSNLGISPREILWRSFRHKVTHHHSTYNSVKLETASTG